jgi:hypothetical protein
MRRQKEVETDKLEEGINDYTKSVSEMCYFSRDDTAL